MLGGTLLEPYTNLGLAEEKLHMPDIPSTIPNLADDQEVSNKKDHLGVLSSDKKIYPKSLKVEKIDGMLWSSVPKIPKRFFLSFIKSYHFADINLFWADIKENAKIRVSSWAKKNQSNL